MKYPKKKLTPIWPVNYYSIYQRGIRKKLKIAGIPDYIYNLTGQGKKDECLCLEKIQDKWSVYYLERGIKTTNEIFDSENDACQFLYDQLMN